jgi:hypothetical protein
VYATIEIVYQSFGCHILPCNHVRQDNNGELTPTELKRILIKRGADFDTANRYVEGFMRICDTDNSGTISFDEFCMGNNTSACVCVCVFVCVRERKMVFYL